MIADRLWDSVVMAALSGQLSGQTSRALDSQRVVERDVADSDVSVDAPFVIPSHWHWSSLGSVVDFSLGKTPKRSETRYWSQGKVPWVSISDMRQGEVIVETRESVSEEALESVFRGRISPAGTLLMSFKLTLGRCSFLGVPAVHNEAIISIFPRMKNSELFAQYLSFALPVLVQSGDIKGAIKGATLNKTSLAAIPVPVPPEEEQVEVVHRLQTIAPLIDQLAELEREREDLDRAFFAALRAAIFQAAASGHLTVQRSEDGNATDLLKDIHDDEVALLNAGKLKKRKQLPDVRPDEPPFEIPANWVWTRLGELLSVKSGKATALNPQSDLTCVPVYGGNGIAGYTQTACVAPSTLVLGRVGYYCGAVHETQSEAWISDNALEVCLHSTRLSVRFMYYLLCWRNLGSFSVATAQPVISGSRIYPSLMPLAPVAEQKRIAAKLDEIMPLMQALWVSIV